ncbi:MAG: Do family serine endopeptidase [Bacteroidota bacterium]
MNKTLQFVAAAMLGSTITLGAYHALELNTKIVTLTEAAPAVASAQYKLAGKYGSGIGEAGMVDFSAAAEKCTPAVVHIKSKFGSGPVAHDNGSQDQNQQNPFGDMFPGGPGGIQKFFFNDPNFRQGQAPAQTATGSGVIISADGYIVTNNHVVENADELEVTLYDKRSYKATLVGTDPSTDIAVIRIKETTLPSLAFGNSDQVKVGNWVLAVGNPFNLSSTVTAGIVSAKGRNLQLLRSKDNASIESFIQTDAAVNPGNSGGALVNLSGDLVGINTAIASNTGTYAGYSFAVPAKIAEKVVQDLITYGVVQRGFLGIQIREVNSELVLDKELKVRDGVYVDSLTPGSSAKDAGVKTGDVIIKADDQVIGSVPQLLETVGRHRPGDKIKLTLNHFGTEREVTVLLKNKEGKTEVVKKEVKNTMETLGMELSDLSNKELKKAGVENGVKVSKLNEGVIRKQTDMRPGFIITKADKKPVHNAKELTELLKGKSGGILLEGIYPEYPGTRFYGFGIE